MDVLQHPLALIEPGAKLGDHSRVSAFAHILAGAIVGNNTDIGDHVYISGDVTIGARVTIKPGVQLGNGARVADNVYIGSNTTVACDRFPSRAPPLPSPTQTVLEAGCSIGANVTIFPGIKIGQAACVEPGSVVTRSVPPNAIVMGNPAQITGYVTGPSTQPANIVDPSIRPESTLPETLPTSIRGVKLHRFPLIKDLRGDLTVGEFARNVPFTPKRYFLVLNVQNREIRGEHAHRKCEQFFVCVGGTCHVVADDGRMREEFVLSGATTGLYVPPMIWATQYKYSPDGVLLVFASEYYDPTDYIRDYTDFLSAVQ